MAMVIVISFVRERKTAPNDYSPELRDSNNSKSVVIPWCNHVAGGRPWVWQQDSAPTHKSKETQAWLQKDCYDFVPFSY